ncbi:hypothetical protein OR1_00258 [Geobacter sp. OR-1]|uniref:LysM peptidoglycan-binding domain-containing protein n=1 Tax=Geobacter sp. OR-1 TaxID=1266765 RepID=UPI0005445090|nr:LysM peptidoglycan-binding domain-containing protein [Geobacter sp. OR-1]GAM07988.1 hypothetical protein OR1_00258 [Geobacter sp. OR-1]
MMFSAARLSTALASLSLLLLTHSMTAFAIDPRFDLDTRMLDSRFDAGKKTVAAAGHAEKRQEGKKTPRSSRYTVKPGDNLYLILMGRYGLSEKEADAVIPRLKEMNGISDIRSLRVGSTITIPLGGKSARPGRTGAVRPAKGTGQSASQQLRMFQQVRLEGSADLRFVKGVWDSLFPLNRDRAEGINLAGQNFELALDPERFPVLPAADGGRILVDPGGKLPPMVKSLVQTLDDVRVVSEDPANVRRFYSALLSEARFFSVAENFSIDFGSSPQLTVTSDYKIEKNPESLMNQDIVLLNVTEGRGGTPPALASFLSRQGFRLIEPLTAGSRPPQERGHRLHLIAGANALELTDRIMDSLDLNYSSDAKVELFGPSDSGLRLDISADRYFEMRGERFIVTRFNGDPVFYTLMRLLETRGYRVVILEERDDFRRVAEKLLSRLRIPARFDRQPLWPARDRSYSVKFPGFMLLDPASGRKTVLTGSSVDPLISELVTLNGYTVFPSP